MNGFLMKQKALSLMTEASHERQRFTAARTDAQKNAAVRLGITVSLRPEAKTTDV